MVRTSAESTIPMSLVSLSAISELGAVMSQEPTHEQRLRQQQQVANHAHEERTHQRDVAKGETRNGNDDAIRDAR